MNVTGVGATPPAAQPPPVAPVVPSGHAEASGTRTHEGGAKEHGHTRPRKKTEEPEAPPPPPPLRLLTVTEMRVMLGQLPPEAERRHGHPEQVRGTYTGR